MSEKQKLPTELAAEICVAVYAGKGGSGDMLGNEFERIFSKILECRKKESEERGKLAV